MTPAEWARGCALIGKLWPHRKLPIDAGEAWYELLADLDGPTVLAAIRTHATTEGGEWPPSIAQIRAHCQPRPRAWEDALAALKRGSWRGDPALEKVAEWYGGWSRIGQFPLTRWDEPAFRAQFREAYQAAQRDVQADQTAALNRGGPVLAVEAGQ